MHCICLLFTQSFRPDSERFCSLHTDFIDEWSAKRDEARRERERLKNEIVSTTRAGRPDATLLTAGQTAGGIKDIPTVAEIMRRLIAETETALAKAAALLEAD